jgi:hypothetical protein
MTSEVLQFIAPATNQVQLTAWFRKLKATENVLYAGFYSVCTLPNQSNPCVKVTFPLPNGNAIVVMKIEPCPDGSFLIVSAGNGFGDPGFYFTVHDHSGKVSGKVWACYVRAMQESIHVFADGKLHSRADHVLKFFGASFLQLHYRMRHQ